MNNKLKNKTNNKKDSLNLVVKDRLILKGSSALIPHRSWHSPIPGVGILGKRCFKVFIWLIETPYVQAIVLSGKVNDWGLIEIEPGSSLFKAMRTFAGSQPLKYPITFTVCL